MEKIQEFIKELHTTYDTNLFENTAVSYQKKCLDYCKINKSDKGNKVLMELTYNHYTKHKPTATFIGGPKTLSIHWHPQYKKIIYIFGEWHADTMDCKKFKTRNAITIQIEDYLYSLMKSTDVFLDIYFEFPFPDKEDFKSDKYDTTSYDKYVAYSKNHSNRLNKLFNKFKNCLVYYTRHNRSCQLARSHYFDIRLESSNPLYLEESKIDIVWVFARLIQMYKLEPNIRANKVFDILLQYPQITIILTKLIDTNKENIYKFMINQLKENRYIKKELSKIVENRENLISAFDSFFYDQIRKKMSSCIDIIQPLIKKILNYKKEDTDILYTSIRKLLFAMISTISFFTDVYLLARVFKDFNMDDMEEKAYKGATHQPNRAHNIIIYAGEDHSDSYRNFLSYIGFTEIDSSGIDLDNPNPHPSLHIPTIPRNCLDMRHINQPFFSYNRYNLSSFDAVKKQYRLPAHTI